MSKNYRFNRSLGMLSGQISKGIGKSLQSMLNKNNYKLDQISWSIISYVKNNPNRTQQDLVMFLWIDKVKIKRVLDELESQNILKRSIYGKDKRYNVINLTEKGISLYNNILPFASEALSKAFKGFSESEEELFTDMLIKVKENLKDEIGFIEKKR
ncbi:MAG: MarR family winged helix-turn-helix transcriptional regulator [Bacteroidales bacterium]